LAKLLSAVSTYAAAIFYQIFQVKDIRLQTFFSSFITTAVTNQQSLYLHFITFCDINNVVCKELYLYDVSPKRKQALPEGNLPAIRLMHIR
jgi:hypothetical protein